MAVCECYVKVMCSGDLSSSIPTKSIHTSYKSIHPGSGQRHWFQIQLAMLLRPGHPPRAKGLSRWLQEIPVMPPLRPLHCSHFNF